jgi:hypothetical protein
MMSNKIELKSIEEPVFENVSIYEFMLGPNISPQTRIKIFSPDEYESFTNSWLYACRNKRYKSTVVYGKAGDKGRDVVGYYSDETWDNYQCKRYEKALSPKTLKLEIGKIIYYSFIGDYTAPQKHYFVSPEGLSNNSIDLINSSQNLKNSILQDWDVTCKTKITTTKEIPLNKKLNNYIANFDFTIFTYIDSEKMINDLYGTKFYPMFFGGGFIKPRSSEQITPPVKVAESEFNYIKCLLDAYGDHYNYNIDSLKTLEVNYPKEYNHFKRQRQYYYTAEALRKYSIESLPHQKQPEKSHFEKLKDEYLCVIEDILDEDFEDGYKCVKEVVKEVARVGCDNSYLKQVVKASDKKGICHHLSNAGKVSWVCKDE